MTYIGLLVFYIIGAFPTGFLLAKSKGIDITQAGSGNVGATNIARSLGKWAGVFVLLVDILKGALVVLIASSISNDHVFVYFSGLAAVLGHCFSFPGILQGGKGVATGLGALLVAAPLLALYALITFSAAFLSSRVVSLGSISACLSIAILSWITIDLQGAIVLSFLALVIFYRHLPNIKKLIEGQELAFEAGS